MEKLEYYRKRFYSFLNYVCDTQGEEVKKYMNQTWKTQFDIAFQNKDMKRLKAFDKHVTESINDYPKEYRSEINRRIESEVGVNAEEFEKKRLKKIQTILKRGKIKNRDEYELVHSRIDELANGTSTGAPVDPDLPELDRILTDYSVSFNLKD